MTYYKLRCQIHYLDTTPLYFRPKGKPFKRCPNLHWCPGINNDPHILKSTGFFSEPINIPIDTL